MSLREELIQIAAVAVAAVQDMDYGSTDLNGEHGYEPMGVVWEDVEREREDQEEKWGPQHHTPEEWMAILAEEVGEASNEVWGDSIGEDLSSYAEFSLSDTLYALEQYARAFLKERFGSDPIATSDTEGRSGE